MSALTHTVPLFPLNLVPFEGEPINLHIFEDRYKALAAHCLTHSACFGIVPYVSDQLCDFGGYMQITEVVERYPDGRLDIRTKCLSRFKLLAFDNPADSQQYATGQIDLMQPDPIGTANEATRAKLTNLVQRLYALLQAQLDPKALQAMHLSYALGHKIGLSLDQEYELFLITTEQERQAYLINHLTQALPSLEEFNRTRARILLNGHFQKFDPLTF